MSQNQITQALDAVRNASAMAPMPLQGHQQVANALTILENVVEDYIKIKEAEVTEAKERITKAAESVKEGPNRLDPRLGPPDPPRPEVSREVG